MPDAADAVRADDQQLRPSGKLHQHLHGVTVDQFVRDRRRIVGLTEDSVDHMASGLVGPLPGLPDRLLCRPAFAPASPPSEAC